MDIVEKIPSIKSIVETGHVSVNISVCVYICLSASENSFELDLFSESEFVLTYHEKGTLELFYQRQRFPRVMFNNDSVEYIGYVPA